MAPLRAHHGSKAAFQRPRWTPTCRSQKELRKSLISTWAPLYLTGQRYITCLCLSPSVVKEWDYQNQFHQSRFPPQAWEGSQPFLKYMVAQERINKNEFPPGERSQQMRRWMSVWKETIVPPTSLFLSPSTFPTISTAGVWVIWSQGPVHLIHHCVLS